MWLHDKWLEAQHIDLPMVTEPAAGVTAAGTLTLSLSMLSQGGTILSDDATQNTEPNKVF